MKNIKTGDCYRLMKDSDIQEANLSWLTQLPMQLLSPSARACMYAVYLAHKGRYSQARSFLALALKIGENMERPYVLHLQSGFEFLSGNVELAVRLALKAKEGAQIQGDKELVSDLLALLSEIDQTTTDGVTGRKYRKKPNKTHPTNRAKRDPDDHETN